jgi:hypothetical protein
MWKNCSSYQTQKSWGAFNVSTISKSGSIVDPDNNNFRSDSFFTRTSNTHQTTKPIGEPMKINHENIDGTMLCIIAFTIGMICAFTGCASSFKLETSTQSLTPNYETLTNENYTRASH